RRREAAKSCGASCATSPPAASPPETPPRWRTSTCSPSSGKTRSDRHVGGRQAPAAHDAPHAKAARVRFTTPESGEPDPFIQKRLAARNLSRTAGDSIAASSSTDELYL